MESMEPQENLISYRGNNAGPDDSEAA